MFERDLGSSAKRGIAPETSSHETKVSHLGNANTRKRMQLYSEVLQFSGKREKRCKPVSSTAKGKRRKENLL